MQELTTIYKGFCLKHPEVPENTHLFVVHLSSAQVRRSGWTPTMVVSPNSFEEAIAAAKRYVDAVAATELVS